jgi:hypothetical protein
MDPALSRLESGQSPTAAGKSFAYQSPSAASLRLTRPARACLVRPGFSQPEAQLAGGLPKGFGSWLPKVGARSDQVSNSERFYQNGAMAKGRRVLQGPNRPDGMRGSESWACPCKCPRNSAIAQGLARPSDPPPSPNMALPKSQLWSSVLRFPRDPENSVPGPRRAVQGHPKRREL